VRSPRRPLLGLTKPHGGVAAWFDEVRKARWRSTADLKRHYATASVVSAERIVFNIKGERLPAGRGDRFRERIVWIKWLGTHRDYDRIDARGVGA
jgi:mRNA interferase HigB